MCTLIYRTKHVQNAHGGTRETDNNRWLAHGVCIYMIDMIINNRQPHPLLAQTALRVPPCGGVAMRSWPLLLPLF